MPPPAPPRLSRQLGTSFDRAGSGLLRGPAPEGLPDGVVVPAGTPASLTSMQPQVEPWRPIADGAHQAGPSRPSTLFTFTPPSAISPLTSPPHGRHFFRSRANSVGDEEDSSSAAGGGGGGSASSSSSSTVLSGGDASAR